MKKTTTKTQPSACQAAIACFALAIAGPGLANENKAVTKANWLTPEVNIRSFQNPGFAQFTAMVSRRSTPPTKLVSAPVSLEGFAFKGLQDGKKTTIALKDYLEGTHTDALLVLHDGKIVFERYFNGMAPYQRHLMMSVTKSFAGTLAAMLVEEGRIDEAENITRYIPELAGTGLGGSTVRNVLDMRTGIDYSEEYANPEADVWKYLSAIDLIPRPGGYTGPKTIREYLPLMEQVEAANGHFEYITPLSEVLVWLVTNVTGKPFHEVLSERIWSQLGMEYDAQFLTESSNQALGGSGLSATARDLARFGQMILQRGTYNGRQVMAPGVVEGFIQGGNREAFKRHASKNPAEKDFSYRDQWWHTHNAHNAFTAWGVHGQFVYIDPTTNVVIVKQSSLPATMTVFATGNDFLFLHALSKKLMSMSSIH